jgi:riboflavin synthase
MFTGLIEDLGTLTVVEARPGGRRLTLRSPAIAADARVGDSISLNGCCLTVIARDAGGFSVEAVPETLARTTLGDWQEGDAVNLERALRFDQRLGGHLVQGHVDGVGVVRAVALEGGGHRVTFDLPDDLARFVAEKGSLAVDGVSLTVARVVAGGCEVALIPHTLKHTTAGRYAPGHRVNLEVDLVARYLARLLDESGVGRRST